jgi:hypothetical protein
MARVSMFAIGKKCPCHAIVMRVPETAMQRRAGGTIYCRRRWDEKMRAAKARRLAQHPNERRPRGAGSAAQRMVDAVTRTEYRKESRARVWDQKNGWRDVIVKDSPKTGRKIVVVPA